jgi:hypothetical protein
MKILGHKAGLILSKKQIEIIISLFPNNIMTILRMEIVLDILLEKKYIEEITIST